ncbi:HPP family protein [Chloroflexota bacterium]
MPDKTSKNKTATSSKAAGNTKSTAKPKATTKPKTTTRVKKSVKHSVSRMRSEFKQLWPNYLFQSILCALCVLSVLWVLGEGQFVIIAAIGASSFIVFAMPKAVTAQPKSIIGGYLLGLAIGALSWLIPAATFNSQIIVYSSVVGLTMFAMVATDTEHPPACGTALGVAIRSWTDSQILSVMLTIVVSATILAAAHVLLAKYLKDLV